MEYWEQRIRRTPSEVRCIDIVPNFSGRSNLADQTHVCVAGRELDSGLIGDEIS